MPVLATRRRALLLPGVLLAGAVATALAGCAPADDGGTGSSGGTAAASSAPACAKDTLQVRTGGKLTVGTDKPAFPPWFVDDEPSNGKGFESAVAYAVAQKLGFAAADVTWTVASFNSVIAPGPKPFDLDINQVSITEERRKNVDFSSGYYDVTQSVVSVKGSKAAGVKTLADLRPLKLGAQVGTTSFAAITDVIKPASRPALFNSNDDAKLALQNGQIDALVVDLPTGLFLAAADLKNGVHARPVAGDRLADRAVRAGAGQGQPADRLRHPGGRRTALGRHAEEARGRVADRAGRSARPDVSGSR